MPEPRIPREALIKLCTLGLVPQAKWRNRDSAAAQRQLGEAWALLSAGCEYEILDGSQKGHRGELSHLKSDEKTIWVLIRFMGFNYFESCEPEPDADNSVYLDSETFYLPTSAQLEKVKGGDWY